MTFCEWHSNKNNPLWVTLNQNNPLWVTFKHLHLSVGVYGRTGLYTTFFYVWTVIGVYRTRNQWMRIWQTYMTMKNPHYTSFFRHIQCEWSWDRTYRDTTPLNLLLKSARTAHSVLNACSTVFILTDTVISKQVYTQVCASMSHTSSSPPSAALGLPTTLHCCLGPYPEEQETFPTSHHQHAPCCPQPRHRFRVRRSLHAIQSDTSVHPQKNVQFEPTHRISFCSETVTHKKLVSLIVTHRKSLCLSVTHRKLFLLKVTHRKM